MQYRRATAAVGAYFFTLNLAGAANLLRVERVDELRASER
jgi:hypothetical protein